MKSVRKSLPDEGQAKLQAIAERLRKLRGNRSQTEFAIMLGIPKQHISRYERADAMPSIVTLLVMADRLRLNLNWLLLGIGKTKRSQ